jgi:hypothetical protein
MRYYCVGAIFSAIVATHPAPKSNIYVIKSITRNICRYSKYRKLDHYMVLSTIRHESFFNPRLKSRTGDYGLMQINIKWSKAKCNLYEIRCNIREGTRMLASWRRACRYHTNHKKTHWLRHYNWNNRTHHLKILWLTEAYKKAAEGHKYLYKIIRDRRKYRRIKIDYQCIKKDLCGALIERRR